MMGYTDDLIHSAHACKTKEQAAKVLDRVTATILAYAPDLPESQARENALNDIGYITGYMDRTDAARVLDLFETKHPYFGKIEDWPKTPEETIALGFKMGKDSLLREMPVKGGIN